MKNIISACTVFMVIFSLILSGCASTPGALLDISSVVNQPDAHFDFYLNGKTFMMATIRGNELTFIEPIPSEYLSSPNRNGFQYYLQRGSPVDGTDTWVNYLGYGKDIGEGGGYSSDYTQMYVNQAGTASIQGYRWTFPSAGWYLVGEKNAVLPIDTKLPDYYWFVCNKAAQQILWLK